jgi:hypothetical protein
MPCVNSTITCKVIHGGTTNLVRYIAILVWYGWQLTGHYLEKGSNLRKIWPRRHDHCAYIAGALVFNLGHHNMPHCLATLCLRMPWYPHTQLLNLPCYSILALYHGDSGTRTMKMRTTFSNAQTKNAKISAQRLQECYNNAYRDARLSRSYATINSGWKLMLEKSFMSTFAKCQESWCWRNHSCQHLQNVMTCQHWFP